MILYLLIIELSHHGNVHVLSKNPSKHRLNNDEQNSHGLSCPVVRIFAAECVRSLVTFPERYALS